MEQRTMTRFHQSSAAASVFLGSVLLILGPPSISWSQEPAAPRFGEQFNPAKGFKPAQSNLTEIFLQIAGSLEATGSPESYIRHMQAEHKRVSALYAKVTGKSHVSRMPSHLADPYLERLIKNWNTLSTPLGLKAFAKEIGDFTREGIMGTRMTGTLAVEIFNEHQKKVVASMSGRSNTSTGFDDLRKTMTEKLEFDKRIVSTAGYETSRRDAVSYASIIADRFEKMCKKIDGIVPPAKAAQIKRSLGEWFLDLGYLAQSELELGILEWSLRK